MIAKKNILILAFEESGDLLAANLVQEALDQSKQLRFYAFSGSKTKAAGAHLLENTLTNAVIGITEVIFAIPNLLKLKNKILDFVIKNTPEAVILVDYPGFNLKLLPKLASLSKVYWYIAPKTWVWKPKRADLLNKYCKKVYAIFPFEKAIYPNKALYFGHPLVDTTKVTLSKEEFLKRYNLKPQNPIIALMPGSRKQEINYILKHFISATKLLLQKDQKLQFLMAKPKSLSASLFNLKNTNIQLLDSESVNLLNAADFVITKSGSITLEATLLLKPMLICYRTNPLTKLVFDKIAQVKFIGLPNLLANKMICPELLQNDLNAKKIAELTNFYLTNQESYQKMQQELALVKDTLGTNGVAKRIATDFIEDLNL